MTTQQALQLAVEHHQAGRVAEAGALYRHVLQREPRHPDALHLLGVLAAQAGQTESAIEYFSLAVIAMASVAPYRISLITALLDANRIDEAVEQCRQAIALQPGGSLPHYHADLGNVLMQLGHPRDAVEAFRHALQLDPASAAILNDYGTALKDVGQLDEAVAHLRRAVTASPHTSEIHNNLANALKDQGRPADAIAEFREALRLDPSNAVAHSNMLFALHLLPAADPQVLTAEHRAWAEAHADPLTLSAPPHESDRPATRRLRVGYVSPDFREHPVGRFILPLLAHHDHDAFEIICYASAPHSDALTQRLRTCADAWHDVFRMDDQNLAQLIRSNRIDILVDLAGHSAGNRLRTFALRSAPVQMTYLGYPDTTGMRAMDWRITDARADPPGSTESLHTEQLLRLPHTAWCFHPPDDAPLPMRSAGRGPTFGSFNSLSKLNDELIALWAKLLRATPTSRLLIKASGLGGTQTRQRLLDTFAAHTISPDRIDLRPPIPSFAAHLATYHEIDVALDSYPYHGTTTTCEALWMGVPVVTLAGATHASRVGVSLLTSAGLADLIATSPDEYIAIAAALLADSQRRTDLRSTLRDRLTRSPLMNASQFARDVESAYRTAWTEDHS